MTDPQKELMLAAKAAVKWMEGATIPNEVNTVLRRLQEAVKRVENQNKQRRRKGGSNAQVAV